MPNLHLFLPINQEDPPTIIPHLLAQYLAPFPPIITLSTTNLSVLNNLLANPADAILVVPSFLLTEALQILTLFFKTDHNKIPNYLWLHTSITHQNSIPNLTKNLKAINAKCKTIAWLNYQDGATDSVRDAAAVLTELPGINLITLAPLPFTIPVHSLEPDYPLIPVPVRSITLLESSLLFSFYQNLFAQLDGPFSRVIPARIPFALTDDKSSVTDPLSVLLKPVIKELNSLNLELKTVQEFLQKQALISDTAALILEDKTRKNQDSKDDSKDAPTENQILAQMSLFSLNSTDKLHHLLKPLEQEIKELKTSHVNFLYATALALVILALLLSTFIYYFV